MKHRVCPVCAFQGEMTAKDYANHKRIHSPRFSCKSCPETFAREDALKRHIKERRCPSLRKYQRSNPPQPRNAPPSKLQSSKNRNQPELTKFPSRKACYSPDLELPVQSPQHPFSGSQSVAPCDPSFVLDLDQPSPLKRSMTSYALVRGLPDNLNHIRAGDIDGNTESYLHVPSQKTEEIISLDVRFLAQPQGVEVPEEHYPFSPQECEELFNIFCSSEPQGYTDPCQLGMRDVPVHPTPGPDITCPDLPFRQWDSFPDSSLTYSFLNPSELAFPGLGSSAISDLS
jgi:hypothetical protein